MPHQTHAHQPAGPIQARENDNQFATADLEPLDHDVLQRMLNELFAAGINLYRALQLINHDTDQARHVETAVTRLDDTITTILYASFTRSAETATDRDYLPGTG